MRKGTTLALAVLALAAGAFAAARIFAQGEASSYVGPRKCKKCHLKEHQEWEGGKHAKAFAALAPGDLGRIEERTKKPCVACHVTGYGRPTGFESLEKTPELAGAGCEACHGPGSLHASREKTENRAIQEANGNLGIRRADGAACLGCHPGHIRFSGLPGKK